MNSRSQLASHGISKKLVATALATAVGVTANLGLATASFAQTTPPPGPASPSPKPPTAITFIGLTPNNTLIRFGLKPGNSGRLRVTGIDGNLQGIDVRPANGLLYGLTDTDKLYTINPRTGAARLVRTLSNSFNGGFQSGADFNPQLDRLRLNSVRQNFSVNVDDGTATPQTALAFAAGDLNAGKDPNVTAAAYTNSVAGATSTQLYNIDYDLDALVLQNPPADGTLTTVGPLGVNFAPISGFDIATDAQGVNTAYAVSDRVLYTIDLTKGTATKVGIAPSGDLIGLAVLPNR